MAQGGVFLRVAGSLIHRPALRSVSGRAPLTLRRGAASAAWAAGPSGVRRRHVPAMRSVVRSRTIVLFHHRAVRTRDRSSPGRCLPATLETQRPLPPGEHLIPQPLYGNARCRGAGRPTASVVAPGPGPGPGSGLGPRVGPDHQIASATAAGIGTHQPRHCNPRRPSGKAGASARTLTAMLRRAPRRG